MSRPIRSVALFALAAAIGGCTMFRLDRPPDEVEQMLRDMGGPGMGCTPIIRHAERMARSELPDGGEVELWIAPTNEGGTMELVIEKTHDGGGSGGGGCGSGATRNGITWSGGMGSFDDGRGTGWVILSGRVPPDAESVRIHFDGEDPITFETQVDGYFMHALAITSMEEMDTRSWADSVDALDADGEVVASLDLDDIG